MKTKTAFSLDWITATFPYPSDMKPEEYTFERDPKVREVKSIGSYSDAVETDLLSVSWSPEHKRMRVMVRMTGRQLSDARKTGATDQSILAWFLQNGGRFTRLDFAVDLMHSEAQVTDLVLAWETDTMKTSAQSVTHIGGSTKDESTGDTVYVGSRTSERVIRAYEKGIQLGTGDDWIRVEIECKKKRAQQMAMDMHESSVASGGLSHMRSHIRETKLDWFEGIFSPEIELFDIDKIGRPMTDKERWIFETCIPAIAEAVKRGMPGVLEAVQAIVNEADDRGKHGPSRVPRKDK